MLAARRALKRYQWLYNMNYIRGWLPISDACVPFDGYIYGISNVCLLRMTSDDPSEEVHGALMASMLHYSSLLWGLCRSTEESASRWLLVDETPIDRHVTSCGDGIDDWSLHTRDSRLPTPYLSPQKVRNGFRSPCRPDAPMIYDTGPKITGP